MSGEQPTCIACGSQKVAFDINPRAWACSSCGYESDALRAERARRWYERTIFDAAFDPKTRILGIPFSVVHEAQTFERFDVLGGFAELGYSGDELVSFRVRLKTPSFETHFISGFRPLYDEWSATFRCRAKEYEPAWVKETHVLEDLPLSGVWFETDRGGRLVEVGVQEARAESVPSDVQEIGASLLFSGPTTS